MPQIVSSEFNFPIIKTDRNESPRRKPFMSWSPRFVHILQCFPMFGQVGLGCILFKSKQSADSKMKIVSATNQKCLRNNYNIKCVSSLGDMSRWAMKISKDVLTVPKLIHGDRRIFGNILLFRKFSVYRK